MIIHKIIKKEKTGGATHLKREKNQTKMDKGNKLNPVKHTRQKATKVREEITKQAGPH